MFVGRFEAGDSGAMGFDYGQYSAMRLVAQGMRSEASSCWDTIAGMPVFVVSWVGDSTFHGYTGYCAGGSWHHQRSGRPSLNLSGCATSVEGQRKILAALRTVEF